MTLPLNTRNKFLRIALMQVQQKEQRRSGVCGEVRKELDHRFLVDIRPENAEHTMACQELMRRMLEKWVIQQGEEPTKEIINFPLDGGSSSVFRRQRIEGSLWKNPKRVELLDWLVKEFADEPVFVWPDGGWTLRSEYSAEVFGYKGDDYQMIDHPTYDEKGELLL